MMIPPAPRRSPMHRRDCRNANFKSIAGRGGIAGLTPEGYINGPLADAESALVLCTREEDWALGR